MDRIKDILKESISIKDKILEDKKTLETIEEIVYKVEYVYRSGNKVLLCGNGGSAADAQHIASELTGKFYKDRGPLSAIALHTDPSYITAISNDYEYDLIYERLVGAYGKEGDILICLSTSGNSKNVIKAARVARDNGLTTIGLTGSTGGQLQGWCDIGIKVPSDDTARIQESHILIGHIICELVEEGMFGWRQ